MTDLSFIANPQPSTFSPLDSLVQGLKIRSFLTQQARQNTLDNAIAASSGLPQTDNRGFLGRAMNIGGTVPTNLTPAQGQATVQALDPTLAEQLQKLADDRMKQAEQRRADLSSYTARMAADLLQQPDEKSMQDRFNSVYAADMSSQFPEIAQVVQSHLDGTDPLTKADVEKMAALAKVNGPAVKNPSDAIVGSPVKLKTGNYGYLDAESKKIVDTGVSFQPNTDFKDMGDRIGIFDSNGNMVSSFAKGLPPQDTPKTKAEQVTATKDAERVADLTSKYPKAQAAIQERDVKDQQIVYPTIEKAIALIDSSTAGPAANLKWVPGTDTQEVSKLLDTIKSNVGLDTLADLKASSPNGASGFGALNETEGEMIRSNLGSLDQLQKPSQLRLTLLNIENYRKTLSAMRRQTFQNEFAPVLPEGGPKGGDSSPELVAQATPTGKTAINRKTGARMQEMSDGTWELIK